MSFTKNNILEWSGAITAIIHVFIDERPVERLRLAEKVI